MTKIKQHLRERMDELAVSYDKHMKDLDLPKAEIEMAKLIEVTDVLVILEAELDGFKPKRND